MTKSNYPGAGEEPGAEVLLDIFKRTATIVLNDDKLRALIRAGQLSTPYYSPRGQDIIAAATAVNLRIDDYVVTIYRGMHDHLAKGVPLKDLWAEYAGRAAGSCKGKGGPMHITHPAVGVMVTTGVVGSGMPIANGLAWASQVKKDGRVTVTNFGDGASNIGAFHESLNMASLWKLPVVFLCQNNRYAEHMAYSKGTAIERISDRSAAYSMPGITVDGNDAIAMWGAAKEAVDRARSGGGPTLIEANTFRFHGHHLGDSGEYMAEGELEAARGNDPYVTLRRLVIDKGYASEAELAAIEDGLRAEIAEAAEYGLSAPFPDESEVFTDVFAEARR
jgi:TPP-dependent pyruvate/acetoin dehydrogenase alpha subunit